MTQNEKVLAYLREYGSISSMEAFRVLGITRLSARIYELRERGYMIDNKPIRKKNGGEYVHYDRYVLRNETNSF